MGATIYWDYLTPAEKTAVIGGLIAASPAIAAYEGMALTQKLVEKSSNTPWNELPTEKQNKAVKPFADQIAANIKADSMSGEKKLSEEDKLEIYKALGKMSSHADFAAEHLLGPALTSGYEKGRLALNSNEGGKGILGEANSKSDDASDKVETAYNGFRARVAIILYEHFPHEKAEKLKVLLGNKYDEPYGDLFNGSHHRWNVADSVANELLKTTSQKVKEKHAKRAEHIESGSFRIEGQGRVVPRSIEEQARLAVSGSAKEITVAPEGGTTPTGMGAKPATKGVSK